MHLSRLTCHHFRRLERILFEPSPGLNVVRGRNAQGKTSLLEAVLFAATSKSHRTNAERELVSHSEDAFRVGLEVCAKDRDISIEANWMKGVKRFKINGVNQTRMSDILGVVKVVLFTPEDIGLVKGGASARRTFLDMEISQLDGTYLRALQEYRSVLRQRNQLLKAERPDERLLSVWEDQLARHGAEMVRQRLEYVESAAKAAASAYRAIAQEEALEVVYKPDVGADVSLLETLQKSRSTDIRRSVTTRGPHRDDIDLIVSGRSARVFGSQGQQKSVALALRLASFEVAKERSGEFPILMLDDVMSELDERRANRLLAHLSEGAQCILTTTELDSKDRFLDRPIASFVMEDGKLAPET